VVGVFAGYVGDLFNFSLLYYFLGCFFYLFFSLLSLFMYMPMNIIFLYIIYYLLPFVDSFVLGLIKLLLLLLLLLILINCENHTHETILKFIITSTTNTLLKNYWGKSND
jgi:ABC-type multidrug transport system permease subunit